MPLSPLNDARSPADVLTGRQAYGLPSGDGALVSREDHERIDGTACVMHREVQMRTGRHTGQPNVADDLTRANRRPGVHRRRSEGIVEMRRQ